MADVPLREYLEALLVERDKALVVQTTELHRRLDTLNHAHEKAIQGQHTYVTEEKFAAFVARFEENKEVTAEALTLARGNALGRSSLTASQLALAMFVVSVVAVFVVLVR